MIGDAECLADFDSAGLFGESHAQRCLCPFGQLCETGLQCFDCEVTCQIFSCPAVPNLVEHGRLDNRLNAPLLAME